MLLDRKLLGVITHWHNWLLVKSWHFSSNLSTRLIFLNLSLILLWNLLEWSVWITPWIVTFLILLLSLVFVRICLWSKVASLCHWILDCTIFRYWSKFILDIKLLKLLFLHLSPLILSTLIHSLIMIRISLNFIFHSGWLCRLWMMHV